MNTEHAHLPRLPRLGAGEPDLQRMVDAANAGAMPLMLLYLDIDHFKAINDTLGHDIGDLLLVEAARRITQPLGPQDTVARMGGDEFTVILGQVPDAPALDAMLQGMPDRLASAFHIGPEQVFVSASMGVALYPRDGEELDALMSKADSAMFMQKSAMLVLR